jgi:hypothetical protein
MKITDDSPPIVSALDRPNSYICPFTSEPPGNAGNPCNYGGSIYLSG